MYHMYGRTTEFQGRPLHGLSKLSQAYLRQCKRNCEDETLSM